MARTHLYNAKLAKVRWFVERFGAREIMLKPLRTIFAPLIIPRLPARTFTFQGQTLPLLYHRYNMTWASERCVEVPIAQHFISKTSSHRVLEVGNVLSHYAPVNHKVLDKFERAPGVINEDITTYQPETKFDLIVSISTFEHIGFDDEHAGASAPKILAAVAACRAMLTPVGRLVLTVPIGYNPDLDELLRGEKLDAARESYLKKLAPLDWRESSKAEALASRYKEPFPYANAVAVLEFGAA